MLTYKQRLELLNDTSDTVWNSIDKPMRRLIFEMNRTGLITRFCCFGMPYGEDDEPKTHTNDNPYVFFNVTEQGFENWNTAAKILNDEQKYFDNRTLYLGKFANSLTLHISDCLPSNFYVSEDMISIHKYESYILTIQNITKVLQSLPGSDIVKIVDGNRRYDNIEMWQIDPKPDFEISTEDFYKKYGKLEFGKPMHHEETCNCISVNNFENITNGIIERKIDEKV